VAAAVLWQSLKLFKEVVRMYVKVPKNKITKMSIIKTDCKMTLKQVVEKYKCNYTINGGLYNMQTGKVNPIPLRIDGKTIATSSDGYWMMAWNTGPDICMIHSRDMDKWENAIACSTILKDGQNTIFTYTSAQGGIRGRTAFGDDRDNVLLYVTTDTNGPLKPEKMRNNAKSYGALNMIMLDCGGSSQLYNNGTYLQAEKRKVAYWICIWTENDESCPYDEPSVSIKRGSSGKGAKWVQWHLEKLGFYNDKIDGIFGKNSTNALLAFQKSVFASNKDHDGICGKRTRDKLKEAVAKL
jgi:hypothetical protein